MENSEFEFYDKSNITMSNGFVPPCDDVLLACAMESPAISTTIATQLVMGNQWDKILGNPPTDAQVADICVLNLVIEFSRKVGHKDIQKFCDMPIAYLRRWNEMWRDINKDFGEGESTPSADELEGWVE